jgi:hypothetical protein
VDGVDRDQIVGAKENASGGAEENGEHNGRCFQSTSGVVIESDGDYEGALCKTPLAISPKINSRLTRVSRRPGLLLGRQHAITLAKARKLRNKKPTRTPAPASPTAIWPVTI